MKNSYTPNNKIKYILKTDRREEKDGQITKNLYILKTAWRTVEADGSDHRSER